MKKKVLKKIEKKGKTQKPTHKNVSLANKKKPEIKNFRPLLFLQMQHF